MQWMSKVVLLIMILAVSLLAQEEYRRFNEYNMQPEVWHFASPVSGQVDCKGDLNLSLPIMKVPGTNGFDYDISFSYKAGITYYQQASWIGLGFNFDPGSISRDVQGNYEKDGVKYGVDYANDPASYKYLPDNFYLTIPGKGTHTMGRANIEGFNDPDEENFHFPYNGLDGFYLQDYKPYKIDYTTGRSFDFPSGYSMPTGKEDFTQFVITTDDGVRYVYGLATIAAFRYYTSPSTVYFPNAWRLLAILGPDVPATAINKLLQDHNDGFGPEDTYSNMAAYDCDWIKFEYQFDDTKGVFSSEWVSPSYYVQNTYLKFIITPTHYAKFNTTDRAD